MKPDTTWLRRNKVRRPGFFVVVLAAVGVVAFTFLVVGLDASGGRPTPPLDDVYIHFQYARALVEGHPFQYNPDQPPTSGGTSLLYPPLLALGYLAGFRGENLGWWALLIGLLSWLGSAWLVYRISARMYAPSWVALGISGAFATQGSLVWAFMSSMETGLMILLTLATLWYTLSADRRGTLVSAVLVALLRPEGIVIGGLAVLVQAWSFRSRCPAARQIPFVVAPFAAALLQPLLNLLMTGSVTASGMQAKSYLYNVPSDLGDMVRNVLNTAGRIWSESYSDPDYYARGLLLIGLVVIGLGAFEAIRTRRLVVTILIAGWLLGLTFAIATLETASWQFKRYQQPMIALMFPLAAWLSPYLLRRGAIEGYAVLGIVAILLSQSLQSLPVFLDHYAGNTREVAHSQMKMAQFVAETLPPDAVVGVHDIGVMRYFGKHTTYDLVGLTTPGAAKPWRHGPGAVYEQMRASPWRPDYFAIYPDARGLTYFEGTGLFREKLAEFPSTAPPYNVASATDSGQNVYRADWTFAAFADDPLQPASRAAIAGLVRVDVLNVARLDEEEAHAYRWWQAAKRPGFATEVYELEYIACAAPTCTVLDGGRLITGGEEMIISTQPGKDLIWITRAHPRNAATLAIFVNGEQAGTRIIPAVPGQWLEFATYIPGAQITGAQTVLRVEANITDPAVGHYMPYYHWFYQGNYRPDTRVTLPGPPATFGDSIQLAGRQLAYDAETRTISVALEWQRSGESPFDAVMFVHLYDSDGTLVEDAQLDRRPGNGTLPPANWLPGTLRDVYTLPVPGSVPPGVYRVAIGLYDPVTLGRLPVRGEGADQDRRLFIGEIEVSG